MDKDYSKLLEKDFVVITTTGDEVPAMLVGADPDIGITIVHKEDKNRYLLCLVSGVVHPLDIPKEAYKALFDLTIKGIEEGKVLLMDSIKIMEEQTELLPGITPGSDVCAFGR